MAYMWCSKTVDEIDGTNDVFIYTDGVEHNVLYKTITDPDLGRQTWMT